MLAVTTDSGTRFVGLRPLVLYRIELGLAVVDDGERLIRIKRAVFDLIIADSGAPLPAKPPEEVLALIEGCPTVFELFADRADAESSLRDKEI